MMCVYYGMLIILGREIALERRGTVANEQIPLSGESDEQFVAAKNKTISLFDEQFKNDIEVDVNLSDAEKACAEEEIRKTLQ